METLAHAFPNSGECEAMPRHSTSNSFSKVSGLLDSSKRKLPLYPTVVKASQRVGREELVDDVRGNVQKLVDASVFEFNLKDSAIVVEPDRFQARGGDGGPVHFREPLDVTCRSHGFIAPGIPFKYHLTLLSRESLV